jgi:isopenicillin-N epimerase
MVDYSRRKMLKMSAGALGLGLSAKLFAYQKRNLTPVHSPINVSPLELARDEKFWQKVASQFQIDARFINLENGYYGIMPDSIHVNYLENTLRVNRSNSYYLRKSYANEVESVRKYLAQVLGVCVDEIALTRGGTEALQNLISGYNKLYPGDQVMYADLDYYSCQYAFNWLIDRRKVSLVKINIPEPGEKQAVLDVYARALDEHPRVKIFLLTHLNNRTGLVLPVAEIIEMARKKGVDVILDIAHSFGQLDFVIEDLGADFVGLSLHKWIHAPLGLGSLYIRKNRIEDIDPCLGDELYDRKDVRARVHSGTKNIAPFLTLPSALDFHLSLGAQVKQERLQYLRNHWVSRANSIDAIEILTPNQTEMYGAITSFRLRGRKTKQENEEIVKFLFEQHGIFTVQRGGVNLGDCVRVTPALFTSIEDVEKLANALEDLARRF